jgi:hypothetical protein
VNIIILFYFPLDLQEKNHVAPKKRGNFGHLQENYKKLPKNCLFIYFSCGIGPSLHGSLNLFNVEL